MFNFANAFSINLFDIEGGGKGERETKRERDGRRKEGRCLFAAGLPDSKKLKGRKG